MASSSAQVAAALADQLLADARSTVLEYREIKASVKAEAASIKLISERIFNNAEGLDLSRGRSAVSIRVKDTTDVSVSLGETVADNRTALASAVDNLAAQKMAEGYPHDFGAPYGVRVLQTRDANDRMNWLALNGVANALLAQGLGDTSVGAFRTADNVNIPVTAIQAVKILTSMQGYLSFFLARAWALKDQIAAAADADLDAIDITAGWPT